MSGGGPLISLDGFAKPVTVLIKKISNALGVIYKPKGIVKEAEARAEAMVIEARAKAEAMKILTGAEGDCLEIQDRALMRLIHEETKKQDNIENIIKQALPDVKESAKPENIDDDWLSNYFDKCKGVANPEMQSLWARILAGEANLPGSFSRRAVNLVSDLGKVDAQLFTNLCTFNLQSDGFYWPLVFELEAEIYEKKEIIFGNLMHLSEIGLVTFNGLTRLGRNRLGKQVLYTYYENAILLELPLESDNVMDVGFVKMTQVGRELSPIAGGQPSNEFFEYLISRWKQQNYQIMLLQ